jgi:hypothetical protein
MKPDAKKPAKEIKAEMLPSRFSRTDVTGDVSYARINNNYAKKPPADPVLDTTAQNYFRVMIGGR